MVEVIKQSSITPLRISFAGGGTDIPKFYLRHGPGATLSMAINRYVFTDLIRHFNSDMFSISYKDVHKDVRNVDDIPHRAAREALKYKNIAGGLQVNISTEIPSEGTGLAASSAFTVGMLNVLGHWQGRDPSPKELAEEAYHVEREILNEAGGKQDQYIAAYGGMKFIRYNKDGTIEVQDVELKTDAREEMIKHFLLLYTGIRHKSGVILEKQTNGIVDHIEDYTKMARGADQLRSRFMKEDWRGIAEVINEGWELKKRLEGSISNPEIEHAIRIGKENGALAAKVLGSGGGGCILFVATPDDHERIKKAVGMQQIQFDYERRGSFCKRLVRG